MRWPTICSRLIALGRRALDAPVINVDETRWGIMGSAHAAADRVGCGRPRSLSIGSCRANLAEEGRQVLSGYRGMVGRRLRRLRGARTRRARLQAGALLAHAKRNDDGSRSTPSACARDRRAHWGPDAIERLVLGPFPGDAAAQALRQQLRQDRSKPLVDRIWHWATVQVGLPCSDFGKAVRYMPSGGRA